MRLLAITYHSVSQLSPCKASDSYEDVVSETIVIDIQHIHLVQTMWIQYAYTRPTMTYPSCVDHTANLANVSSSLCLSLIHI